MHWAVILGLLFFIVYMYNVSRCYMTFTSEKHMESNDKKDGKCIQY